MVDFIQTPLSNETRDAIINQSVTGAVFIRPIVEQASNYMSGSTIAFSIFVLGGIFLLLTIGYVLFMVFGKPMSVASKEGSLIQHFDTPKSAVIKEAVITGGAFRYRNLKDGTCAVTTKSIVSINGKNAIITFEGLGISIPIPHLAAMTKLAENDIKLLLNRDEETGEYTYKLNKQLDENLVIISGYNFDNFNEMLKQTKNKMYIPLMIESVKNFVTKNISANYTEKQIKIRQMILAKSVQTGDSYGAIILYGAVGIILLMITFYMTK